MLLCSTEYDSYGKEIYDLFYMQFDIISKSIKLCINTVCEERRTRKNTIKVSLQDEACKQGITFNLNITLAYVK